MYLSFAGNGCGFLAVAAADFAPYRGAAGLMARAPGVAAITAGLALQRIP